MTQKTKTVNEKTRCYRVAGLSLVKEQGSAAVRTSGDVLVCHNMRVRGEGLAGVGTPQRLRDAAFKPVYSDVMQGSRWLFTQEDDGTVYVERVADAGTTEGQAVALGRVEATITGGASAGDFVVLLTEGGQLLYILREPATPGYRWLGVMPELPAFSLTLKAGAQMNAEIEPTAFSSLLTSVANPVPEDISRKVRASWVKAWETLNGALHASGQWCEPVDVRLALRLWDGTRLHVSEPVRLAPSERPGRGRVTLGLLYSEEKKGFTGTAGGILSGSGFTFDVRLATPLPEAWADIVKGVEIWVSREPETLAGEDAALRCTFLTNADGNFVSFTPPVRQESAIDADVEGMPAGQVAFWASGRLSGNVVYKPDIVYDSAVEEYFMRMPGAAGDAACILGYGGFLHIGSGDGLYTSVRGNPLVVKSVSGGLGTRVRSLCPQLTGGGAYTRQYIYAATDRGIIAVTHKPDGEHTNSRPVSPEPLGDGCLWLATPQGVYALTLTGSLLRLRDAKAPSLLCRVKRVETMLWSNAYEELWLCRRDGTVVIQPTRGNAAYTRPEFYRPVPGVYAPSLAWIEDEQGFFRLHTMEEEEAGPGESSYSALMELDGDGWLRRLTFHLTAEEGVRYAVTDSRGRRVCSGRYPQRVEGCTGTLLALAHTGSRLAPSQRRLRLDLQGKFTELNYIEAE